MSFPILSKALPSVNTQGVSVHGRDVEIAATDTAVFVILTDGKAIYDQRCIDPADLPWLNQIAQETTEGQLWWEIRGGQPHDQ